MASTFGQTFVKNSINQPYRVLVQSNDGGVSPSSGGISIEAWLPEEVNLDVAAQYEAPYAQGINDSVPGWLSSMSRALGVNLVTQAMTAQVWQGGTEIQFNLPLVFQAETSAYGDVMFPIRQLLKLTMPKDPTNGGLLESPGPHINIEKLKTPVGSPSKPSTPTPQIASGQSTSGTGVSGIAKTITSIGKDVASSAEKMSTNWVDSLVNKGIDFGVSSVKTAKSTANQLVSFSNQLINAIEGNISLYLGSFIYIPSVVITDVSPTFNILIAPDGNPSRAQVNVTFKMFYIPTQNDLDIIFWNKGPNVPSGSKVA